MEAIGVRKMKININYLGLGHLFHIRRDSLEFLRGNLESVGCDVAYRFNELTSDRFNLLLGTSELSIEVMRRIKEEKRTRYAVFDTEVITGNTINYRQDFPMEAYVDFVSGGEFVMCGISENLRFWQEKGLRAVFYSLGYTDRLKEINLKEEREIDAFFYGLMPEYRISIIRKLAESGLQVKVNGYKDSPYFLRNSFIEQSKLVLNVTQGPKYSHINGLRALYLATNGCCTVGECPVNDSYGYDVLQHTSDSIDHFIEDCHRIIKDKAYLDMGKEFQRIAERDFDNRSEMEKIVALCQQ